MQTRGPNCAVHSSSRVRSMRMHLYFGCGGNATSFFHCFLFNFSQSEDTHLLLPPPPHPVCPVTIPAVSFIVSPLIVSGSVLFFLLLSLSLFYPFYPSFYSLGHFFSATFLSEALVVIQVSQEQAYATDNLAFVFIRRQEKANTCHGSCACFDSPLFAYT